MTGSRTRPLDAGRHTFVAADALVLKVREGGRVVGVHALIATGVNADGHREILGHVTSGEDGAGWLAFFRDLTARGLTGVALVTSDAHAGLVAAIGATLPGASWQRCPNHYAANLMSVTPKSGWAWVKTLLHSVYNQPDADAVHPQYDRILDALQIKLPAVVAHLDAARADVLAFTAFPKELWRQIWSNNPRNASTGRSAAAPTSSGSSPTGAPHPPRRRGPGRATRRLDRRTALPRPGRPHPQPRHLARHPEPGGERPADTTRPDRRFGHALSRLVGSARRGPAGGQ